MNKHTFCIAAFLLGTCPLFAAKQAPVKNIQTPRSEAITGNASWYGGRWIGRLTANGETYRSGDMTAAHKTLPFNTRVKVTDERTGRSTIVRINNRGPFVKGRVLDLSQAAAQELGITSRGVARVKLEVIPKEPIESDEPAPAKKRFFTWFAPSVAVN